jgi:hypothetical protein
LPLAVPDQPLAIPELPRPVPDQNDIIWEVLSALDRQTNKVQQ